MSSRLCRSLVSAPFFRKNFASARTTLSFVRGSISQPHHIKKGPVGTLFYMARPKGFEPLTPRFVVWCSIQLSYGRIILKTGVLAPKSAHGKRQGPRKYTHSISAAIGAPGHSPGRTTHCAPRPQPPDLPQPPPNGSQRPGHRAGLRLGLSRGQTPHRHQKA